MARLDDHGRATFLADHPNWDLDGEIISSTFEFADFNEAIGFVNRVALSAEKVDHHPDIEIHWNRVSLALTTHREQVLTQRDVDLAAECDRLGGR